MWKYCNKISTHIKKLSPILRERSYQNISFLMGTNWIKMFPFSEKNFKSSIIYYFGELLMSLMRLVVWHLLSPDTPCDEGSMERHLCGDKHSHNKSGAERRNFITLLSYSRCVSSKKESKWNYRNYRIDKIYY